MKGQSVNIDWSIGLSIFLVTVLSSVLILSGSTFSQDNSGPREKAEEIEDSISDEISSQSYKSPLIMASGTEIQNIPVYTSYFYSTGQNTSGTMEEPSYVNRTENRFAAVVDKGNQTFNLTYVGKDLFNSSYYSDLDSQNSWTNNSLISLKRENPGITSLRINGEEVLNSNVTVSISSTLKEEEVFHQTSGENLTVFNSSQEILVKDESFTFYTQNFSTLYWHSDGSEYSLDQSGTVKQGDTQGLTVANTSIGLTFMGNMTAEVSRPSNSIVKISIDSNSTRVRLHESGTGYGKKRIESFVDGEKFFGVERRIRPVFEGKIREMDNLSEQEFEDMTSIENYGYNISITLENSTGTYTLLSRGEDLPLQKTSIQEFTENLLQEDGSLEEVSGRIILWE